MLKVLIADDDSAMNVLLKRLLLRWGFDIVTVFDGAQAWKILQEENAPPIAILDWMMPEMDGLEICRRLREKEKGSDQHTYVIISTVRGETTDIVAGLDSGADDYIVKPFDKDEMRARLAAGQRIVELHEALRVANKRLLIMSRLDPLTGALSRNAILDDLDLAMYRAVREKKPLTVSLVDLDDLKFLNEQYGRNIGDQVLQHSVHRINASLRRTDYFGRYGGDEFLVILLGIDSDRGMTVCHRIRKAIAEEDMVINGFTFHITASQSMAVWDGKIGVDDLMASVERSLMETKINGPNRLTSVN